MADPPANPPSIVSAASSVFGEMKPRRSVVSVQRSFASGDADADASSSPFGSVRRRRPSAAGGVGGASPSPFGPQAARPQREGVSGPFRRGSVASVVSRLSSEFGGQGNVPDTGGAGMVGSGTGAFVPVGAARRSISVASSASSDGPCAAPPADGDGADAAAGGEEGGGVPAVEQRAEGDGAPASDLVPCLLEPPPVDIDGDARGDGPRPESAGEETATAQEAARDASCSPDEPPAAEGGDEKPTPTETSPSPPFFDPPPPPPPAEGEAKDEVTPNEDAGEPACAQPESPTPPLRIPSATDTEATHTEGDDDVKAASPGPPLPVEDEVPPPLAPSPSPSPSRSSSPQPAGPCAEEGAALARVRGYLAARSSSLLPDVVGPADGTPYLHGSFLEWILRREASERAEAEAQADHDRRLLFRASLSIVAPLSTSGAAAGGSSVGAGAAGVVSPLRSPARRMKHPCCVVGTASSSVRSSLRPTEQQATSPQPHYNNYSPVRCGGGRGGGLQSPGGASPAAIVAAYHASKAGWVSPHEAARRKREEGWTDGSAHVSPPPARNPANVDIWLNRFGGV